MSVTKSECQQVAIGKYVGKFHMCRLRIAVYIKDERALDFHEEQKRPFFYG